VNRWLNEEYPEIRKLAKKQGATIYFGDEAGVRSDYHSGTTWGIRGKTPTVKTTGARFSMNLISAVSAQGAMRFMTVEGRMNSDNFIIFLKRLIHNQKDPIFLIVDGHPSHKSGKVKKYIATTEGKLRLFLLPPYSPDLNPDEMVWNHLKNHHIGRKSIKGPDHLKKMVLSCLRSLQRMPHKIRGFFLEPKVQYAIL